MKRLYIDWRMATGSLLGHWIWNPPAPALVGVYVRVAVRWLLKTASCGR